MKKSKQLKKVTAGLALGLATSLMSSPVLAEIIENITVVGTQRVEPDTVRTYLSFQEGDEFNSRQFNRSLKKLFASGFFADVTFKKEGSNLVINVVENPVINRIAFEGNRKLDDETLDTEITLRPRVVYTRARVQQDVERILTLYRRSGRFAATVEPKVIQLDQNRIDLAFEIDEGEPTGIAKIRFVGNKRYSDGSLRDIVSTRETRWYNIFTADDNYDPDRLNYDRELLRRYYLSQGYADFKVTSAVAELSPKRDEFFITYTIDEGSRYEINSVTIANNLKGLNDETVSEVSEIEVGDWYNSNEVDETVNDLVDAVGQQGLPFVSVNPKIDKDSETKKIDLTFEINEGPRVFVERIDIKGNFRTLDKVIRREFQLVEGDALNASKLNRSEQRIRNLNFFENVEVKQVAGSTPDQKIIDVNVEEKSTGSLSLGAGYSSLDGVIGNFGISENNLLGKGQKLAFNASLSSEKARYNISFTEPYFLDRELAAGFDVYNVTEEEQDSSSHDKASTGLILRAGYPLTSNLDQSWSYKIDKTTIENVASDASTLIKSQEGDEITSSITHGLSYDRRNNKLTPSEGYQVNLSNTVAGLGGTNYYLRNQLSGVYYYPIKDDKWVLNTRGRVGHIVGLGEDVKMINRYFLGGDNFRGFDTSGVGPRDKSTDDALGGEVVVNGSTELKFPLGLPNEYQISGLLFSDYGTLSELNPKDSNTLDTGSIRASAGVGLAWVSPMGPISISWSKPFAIEDHDKEENFSFTFGTRF